MAEVFWRAAADADWDSDNWTLTATDTVGTPGVRPGVADVAVLDQAGIVDLAGQSVSISGLRMENTGGNAAISSTLPGSELVIGADGLIVTQANNRINNTLGNYPSVDLSGPWSAIDQSVNDLTLRVDTPFSTANIYGKLEVLTGVSIDYGDSIELFGSSFVMNGTMTSVGTGSNRGIRFRSAMTLTGSGTFTLPYLRTLATADLSGFVGTINASTAGGEFDTAGTGANWVFGTNLDFAGAVFRIDQNITQQQVIPDGFKARQLSISRGSVQINDIAVKSFGLTGGAITIPAGKTITIASNGATGQQLQAIRGYTGDQPAIVVDPAFTGYVRFNNTDYAKSYRQTSGVLQIDNADSLTVDDFELAGAASRGAFAGTVVINDGGSLVLTGADLSPASQPKFSIGTGVTQTVTGTTFGLVDATAGVVLDATDASNVLPADHDPATGLSASNPGVLFAAVATENVNAMLTRPMI